jgi:hypothetical protein
VTEENVDKIFKEHGNKEVELELTKKKAPAQLWSEELAVLKGEYGTFLEERRRMMMGDDEKPKKKKVSSGSVKKGVKNIVVDDE